MPALLILVTCCCQAQTIPVSNGGFEEGLAGWYLETGSPGDDAGGPNVAELAGEGEAAEGAGCARLVYRSSWLWLTTSSLPDSVRGRQLTVALRARCVSGTGELDLGFTEFPKGQRTWAAAHDFRFVAMVPEDGAWHELVVPVDVPWYDTRARDIGLKIGRGQGGAATILLDDVRVIGVGPSGDSHPAPIMVENPGCEDDGADWSSELGDGSTLTWPRGVAHSGEQCAELQQPGHGYAWLSMPMPGLVPGQEFALELWAQRLGDSDRLMAGFSVLSQPEGRWLRACDDAWSGTVPMKGEWCRLQLPLRVPAYDAQNETLALKMGLAGEGAPATYRLDDIRVVGQPEVSLPPAAPAGDLPLVSAQPGSATLQAHVGPVEVSVPATVDPRQGHLAPLSLVLRNRSRRPCEIGLCLRGPDGAEMDACTVALPARDQRTETLALRSLQALPHQVVVEVRCGRRRLGLAVDVTPHSAFPVFGVVEHFDRRPPGPVRAARDVALLPELPCSAYRIDCGWAYVEPRRGEAYDFARTDAYMSLVRDAGRSPVLMMLGYQPGWAGAFSDPTDEALMASHRAAIRAIVQRYADEVDYWEAWNEPSGFWFGAAGADWLGKGPAMLLAVQKTVWEAVRELDPTARVLTPGFIPDALRPGTTEWKVIEKLYALGFDSYFDAMSVHIYPRSALPPATPYSVDGLPTCDVERWRRFDADVSMAALADLMVRLGQPKPIWVTEFGGLDPTDERRQALACLRMIGIMASQRLEGAQYYELLDYPHDAHPPRLNLARTRDLHRTPGFAAYQDAIAALTGAQPAPATLRVSAPQDIETRTFARGAERIVLLWSNASTPQPVHIDWGEEVVAMQTVSWNPARSPMRTVTPGPAGPSLEARVEPLEFMLLTGRAEGWGKG